MDEGVQPIGQAVAAAAVRKLRVVALMPMDIIEADAEADDGATSQTLLQSVLQGEAQGGYRVPRASALARPALTHVRATALHTLGMPRALCTAVDHDRQVGSRVQRTLSTLAFSTCTSR